MPLRGYENNLVRQASQRTKMGISDLPRKSISGINMIYTAAPSAQSQLVVKAGETGSRIAMGLQLHAGCQVSIPAAGVQAQRDAQPGKAAGMSTKDSKSHLPRGRLEMDCDSWAKNIDYYRTC